MTTAEKPKRKVESKAKAKLRHERAINKFITWLVENPEAPKAIKVETFDLLVDES